MQIVKGTLRVWFLRGVWGPHPEHFWIWWLHVVPSAHLKPTGLRSGNFIMVSVGGLPTAIHVRDVPLVRYIPSM